jgi:general secretion pathway protein N
MKDSWRLAIVGGTAFVLFFLLSAPAAKLLPWLQPQLQGLRLSGISGSLWSGRAQQLDAGRIQLDDVRWQLQPLMLFTGALQLAVDAQLAGQPLRAHPGLGLLSGAYVADATGRMAAADLLYLAGFTMVELGGQLEFAIDEVSGIGRGFPAVAGSVSWAPARILAPLELELGSAQLQTHIESGITRGQLAASGGALTVNGDVTVNPDGTYQLVGEVQKRGQVPQAVDKFLATFAEFSNGSYRLEWSDQIKF